MDRSSFKRVLDPKSLELRGLTGLESRCVRPGQEGQRGQSYCQDYEPVNLTLVGISGDLSDIHTKDALEHVSVLLLC